VNEFLGRADLVSLRPHSRWVLYGCHDKKMLHAIEILRQNSSGANCPKRSWSVLPPLRGDEL